MDSKSKYRVASMHGLIKDTPNKLKPPDGTVFKRSKENHSGYPRCFIKLFILQDNYSFKSLSCVSIRRKIMRHNNEMKLNKKNS